MVEPADRPWRRRCRGRMRGVRVPSSARLGRPGRHRRCKSV